MLLQFISRTNPKNIRFFMRKKAPFSGFHNGGWKLKKGYPFFSFECEIQRNTLIFRHFSFSSYVFFAKSRIARSDHWLVSLQKWSFFQLFFWAISARVNVFYDILEGKNAFLGYKNNKFKKSKKWHFSKGVNPWLWSKNGYFSNFLFLGNKSAGKCLLRYSWTKKRLSGL